MELKNKLEDYTEAEFLSLLNKIWAVDVSEEEHDNLIDHFEKLSEHPNGNGLIFYPENGVEDSPEGVLKVIKEWRAKNGKPGFKK
ncbi:Colicin immunity protein / pyocin immunity protein [Photorhabdus khanii NC19]|uniref:Colicin immunity protein / pyocin immunity protein n=1 Tax=Photorhabdus khanii NC19 TaxID=1004151 RepID=W3V1K6_9GAMM|nr:bacteriocin immunity protein [Photorhabdus khanii]ETS29683.1 Colicin immunity protein / pyocin immunity protein [Photorhabdus khanii NC19]